MKYIGVDIGTSNIKVIIYDEAINQIIAKQIEKTPVHKDEHGFVHRPSEIYDIVLRLIKQVIGQISDISDIAALSVSSVGEEVVFLDEQNRSNGDAIVWYDQRGKDEAEAFFQEAPNLFHGVCPDLSFSLFKLLWIKAFNPDELKQCTRLVDFGGYVLGRLCENYVMDWTHASRTGVFDLITKEWNQEIIAQAGLDVSIFPPLVSSGTPIGQISKQIAEEIGLHGQLTIVSGGHDHLCGAYASGVRHKGEIFISAGTSESHLLITDRPIPNLQMYGQIDQGCFVDDQHYYIMASLPSGHVFKQWKQLIFSNVNEDEMYAEIDKVPRSSEGVTFQLSTDLKQEFLSGLSYLAERSVIMRAILEGLALKSSEIINLFTKLSGENYKRLVVSGHPTRIKLWKNIRASVYNKNLMVVEEIETAALGAALLAQLSSKNGSSQSVVLCSEWRCQDL